jgi:hypothetical protein
MTGLNTAIPAIRRSKLNEYFIHKLKCQDFLHCDDLERTREGRKVLRLTLIYCDSGLSDLFTLRRLRAIKRRSQTFAANTGLL